MSGIEAAREAGLEMNEAPDTVKLVVVNTKLKLKSEEFAQLSGVTGSTSAGSAKVMSTQLNSPAPCNAASTTWMLALSPI